MGNEHTLSALASTQRRVILIHRYFSPDTPAYGSILEGIAMALGESGHRVTVLTCQPSYNRSVVSRAPRRESLGPNVDVRRYRVLSDRQSAALKLVNLVSFGINILASATQLGHVDVIMAASTPPVGIARVGAILAHVKRAAFVYHHQDIYPEILQATRRVGRVFRILRAIDSRTDKRARAVVVLSQDMASTIRRRGVPASNIHVINNFDPWRLPEEDATRTARLSPDRSLNVVYAGNVGHFQGLDHIFEAMVQLRNDPIMFHFIGEGPLRDHLDTLVATHQLDRVNVHGYQSPPELADFLRTRADIGLVPLRPGVVAAAYPSKTMSYLRNRVPVVAVVESDSALSQELQRSGAGWVADPANADSVVSLLRKLAASRGEVDNARERAQYLYDEHFSKGKALDRWMQMFDQLVGAGA